MVAGGRGGGVPDARGARRFAQGRRLPEERARLPKCRATRCERFHDVEPLASRLSKIRELLSERGARLSERRERRYERFHDVEPFASRLSLERARRLACPEVPPLIRASPRAKGHGLAEVGEPRLRRHARPHGVQRPVTGATSGASESAAVGVTASSCARGPPGLCESSGTVGRWDGVSLGLVGLLCDFARLAEEAGLAVLPS